MTFESPGLRNNPILAIPPEVSHLSKLEGAGYVEITKEFLQKKPHTMVQLTESGRDAFDAYRRQMKSLFEDLPEA